MRNLLLVTITVLTAGLAVATTSTPAAAHDDHYDYDYPWCLQSRGLGIPGDCSYQTYAQCMASASGRYAWCDVNPRVAFARQRRGLPPYPEHFHP